jgi:hypothetical protein
MAQGRDVCIERAELGHGFRSSSHRRWFYGGRQIVAKEKREVVFARFSLSGKWSKIAMELAIDT